MADSRGFVSTAILVFGTLLFAGCAHQPVDDGDASAGRAEVAPKLAPTSNDTGPRFEVASNIEGKVVSVRKDLRFVIIDFSFSRLPEPGVTMALVREGKPVGKVRITTKRSQARGGAMVADIKEGEPRAGDLVMEMLDSGS